MVLRHRPHCAAWEPLLLGDVWALLAAIWTLRLVLNLLVLVLYQSKICHISLVCTINSRQQACRWLCVALTINVRHLLLDSKRVLTRPIDVFLQVDRVELSNTDVDLTVTCFEGDIFAVSSEHEIFNRCILSCKSAALFATDLEICDFDRDTTARVELCLSFSVRR